MTTQWNLDLSHSSISFWVRHLMVSKVHGRFASWTGSLTFDPLNPDASHVEVSIDAASLDTREPQRDAHLRSADFLDVEQFPHITFASRAIETHNDGSFALRGDLTIRGVTRPVTLEVEYAGEVKDPWGGTRAGFAARTTIVRSDFGLTWNQALEAGGVMVGDKVEIAIEVEAIKAVAVAA